jgi:hypothetical protein
MAGIIEQKGFQEEIEIAVSDQTFFIGSSKTSTTIYTKTNSYIKHIDGKKYFIVFKNMIVNKLPDGVYEVYLDSKKQKSATLHSGLPAFISVLDLYTPHGDLLKMDITTVINKLLTTRKQIRGFYLTILFRGNSLPGAGKSANAGNIRFKGISIFRV